MIDRIAEIEEKFNRRHGTLQWFFAGDPGETFDGEVAELIAMVKGAKDAMRNAARSLQEGDDKKYAFAILTVALGLFDHDHP